MITVGAICAVCFAIGFTVGITIGITVCRCSTVARWRNAELFPLVLGRPVGLEELELVGDVGRFDFHIINMLTRTDDFVARSEWLVIEHKDVLRLGMELIDIQFTFYMAGFTNSTWTTT